MIYLCYICQTIHLHNPIPEMQPSIVIQQIHSTSTPTQPRSRLVLQKPFQPENAAEGTNKTPQEKSTSLFAWNKPREINHVIHKTYLYSPLDVACMYILLLHDIVSICLLRKNVVFNIFVYRQRSLKCINTWNNESDRSKRACSTLAFLWQSLPVLFVMLQYVFTTGISNWRLCYTSPHDSGFNPMAVLVPAMNPSQLLLLWSFWSVGWALYSFITTWMKLELGPQELVVVVDSWCFKQSHYNI